MSARESSEYDDDRPTCPGCHRYWRAVRKSGYCDECDDAMREDHEHGQREERAIERARNSKRKGG